MIILVSGHGQQLSFALGLGCRLGGGGITQIRHCAAVFGVVSQSTDVCLQPTADTYCIHVFVHVRVLVSGVNMFLLVPCPALPHSLLLHRVAQSPPLLWAQGMNASLAFGLTALTTYTQTSAGGVSLQLLLNDSLATAVAFHGYCRLWLLLLLLLGDTFNTHCRLRETAALLACLVFLRQQAYCFLGRTTCSICRLSTKWALPILSK